MKRSDRQRALIDLLRARAEQPMSVTRLAARFAVSARTIERDIRALQDSGVPIYGVPGRTGGYAIGRDYSLPPLRFARTEALAILAGLAVMSGSPLAADAALARDKVLAAMGPDARAVGRALAARVAVLAPEDQAAEEIVAAVRDVVVEPRVVDVVYEDPRSGAVTQRAVEPLGLILVRENWVLVGWCRLREGVRGFRIDAIRQLAVTEEVPPTRSPDPLAEDLSRWRMLTSEDQG